MFCSSNRNRKLVKCNSLLVRISRIRHVERMWTFNSVTRALHTWQMRVGNCECMCVCVCAGVSTPLEIEWIMQVAGCWQSFHLCGWNWIYAEETFSFRVKARLSIRFMRYAVACHMPHIPAARILLPFPLSLSPSLWLFHSLVLIVNATGDLNI